MAGEEAAAQAGNLASTAFKFGMGGATFVGLCTIFGPTATLPSVVGGLQTGTELLTGFSSGLDGISQGLG